jgi:hypothetical protein
VIEVYSNGVYVAGDDDGNGPLDSLSAVYGRDWEPGTYNIRVVLNSKTATCANYFAALDVFEKQTTIDALTFVTNSVELSWYGDAAMTYTMQTASNLVGTSVWSTGTEVEGRSGVNRWRDTVPPDRRFYRILTR